MEVQSNFSQNVIFKLVKKINLYMPSRNFSLKMRSCLLLMRLCYVIRLYVYINDKSKDGLATYIFLCIGIKFIGRSLEVICHT